MRINIFIIGLLFLWLRVHAAQFTEFSGHTQGTTYHIVYQERAGIPKTGLQCSVDSLLKEFDHSFSLYDTASLLCHLNRNEPVIVNSLVVAALNQSRLIWAASKGAFDITVGPLVKAWGFGPNETNLMDTLKLDSLKHLVGMDKIRLNGQYLEKAFPGIQLDFNAIAQGLAVDLICDLLQKRGLRAFLVEIGGEVRTRGNKNGKPWRIGIDKPDENGLPGQSLEAVLELENEAVSTSGNYRKFYIKDGIKYSHTINPKSGRPVRSRLLSATIVAKECSLADGYATACMVMGLDSAKGLVKNHPEIEVYFIYSDSGGALLSWSSSRLKSRIKDAR